MAMGKPVICWISDFMKDHYPSELPLIRANPANITEVIESVLKNRDMLPEIGQKGRKYAEVHHDMVKNSKKHWLFISRYFRNEVEQLSRRGICMSKKRNKQVNN